MVGAGWSHFVAPGSTPDSSWRMTDRTTRRVPVAFFFFANYCPAPTGRPFVATIGDSRPGERKPSGEAEPAALHEHGPMSLCFQPLPMQTSDTRVPDHHPKPTR